MVEHELFVTCLAGLENSLARELRSLGLRRVRPLRSGVAIFTNAEGALRVCLYSRLAVRVMLILARIDAHDAEKLYAGARAIEWENTLRFAGALGESEVPGASGVPEGNGTCVLSSPTFSSPALSHSIISFAVHATGTNEALRNTHFSALKVKDALHDRVFEKIDIRPPVNTSDPDAAIDVRIRGNRATISLDLSACPLNQRSYLDPKLSSESLNAAALSCSVAAGLLALAKETQEIAGIKEAESKKDRGCIQKTTDAQEASNLPSTSVFDPACTEGYIVIEAALRACDAAPNLERKT